MLSLLGVEDEARSDNLVLMLILMLMLSCLEKGDSLSFGFASNMCCLTGP